MKKTLAAMLMTVLVLVAPLSTSQEEVELTAEDEQELSSMDTPYGAQVRLLQLERAIQRNILAGAAAVDAIKNDTPEANVTNLNSILDLMEVLLVEVNDEYKTIHSASNSSFNSSYVAQQFVALKSGARNLSKRFRDSARGLLTDARKQRALERLREYENYNMTALNESINTAKNLHNSKKVQSLLDKMGIDDDLLVENVRTGSITIKEARQLLKEHFKSLNAMQKKQAALKIMEDMSRAAVHREAIKGLIKKTMSERLENKAKLRQAKADKLATNANQSFEKRSGRLDALEETHKKNSSWMQDKSTKGSVKKNGFKG